MAMSPSKVCKGINPPKFLHYKLDEISEDEMYILYFALWDRLRLLQGQPQVEGQVKLTEEMIGKIDRTMKLQ